MFFPISTPAGITECSPMVTRSNWYTLGSYLLGRIPGSQTCACADPYVLCHNGFIHNCICLDDRILHDDGIPDHSALFDHNAGADDGIGDLSIDLRSLSDDALSYLRFCGNELGRDLLTLGIDLPVLLIQIEFPE